MNRGSRSYVSSSIHNHAMCICRLKGQQGGNYSFEIRTNQTDALLWWEGVGVTLSSDYLAIAIIDGRPAFVCNLGNDPQVISSMLKTNRVIDLCRF